jgi:hypothetical protein
MVEFKSPEELRVYLKDKVDLSDSGRIDKAELSTSTINDRKTIYDLKVIVDGSRQEILEIIYNQLLQFEYSPVINYDSSSRSTIGYISVPTGVNLKGKPITTNIVVKLTTSALMVKDGMFNVLLLNLPNFNSIKYLPDNNYEYEIIRDFNRAVMKYGEGDPVTIKIQSRYYKDIIGMVGGPSGAKADLILVDRQGNYAGFISHKHGNTPDHFQQYSGISTRSGIFNNTEVQNFRNDVVSKKDEVLQHPVYRKIRDVNLKKQAVFGYEHKSIGKMGSANNIDFLAQGRLVITHLNRGTLQIGFTTKLVYKNDINRLIGSEYDPILGARKGEIGRKLEGDTEVVYGIRGGIFPEQYMTTRKNSKEI